MISFRLKEVLFGRFCKIMYFFVPLVSDTGRLYPHLYNIHPSVLSQLGTKHSRLGAHLQDQLQVSGCLIIPWYLHKNWQKFSLSCNCA